MADLLSLYRRGAGYGTPSTSNILNRSRVLSDIGEDKRQNTLNQLFSAGKAGLAVRKTIKDFELAKLGNPDLTFKSFMTNPSEVNKQFMSEGIKQFQANLGTETATGATSGGLSSLFSKAAPVAAAAGVGYDLIKNKDPRSALRGIGNTMLSSGNFMMGLPAFGLGLFGKKRR